MTEKANWRNEAIASAVVAALLLCLWWFWPAPKPPVGETKPAEIAKEAKKAKTAAVTPKRLSVYPQYLKADLTLPAGSLGNINEYVVSTSRVSADDHPHTITTTVDIETGEVKTFDRRDPLPWLAVRPSGAVGIYYGLKNGEQAARLQARQNLLQVKAVHIGGLVSVDQSIGNMDGQTDWFAGVGAEYRW